jgi:hypothetical protein
MGKWIVPVSGHPEYQNAGKGVSKSSGQHEPEVNGRDNTPRKRAIGNELR